MAINSNLYVFIEVPHIILNIYAKLTCRTRNVYSTFLNCTLSLYEYNIGYTFYDNQIHVPTTSGIQKITELYVFQYLMRNC